MASDFPQFAIGIDIGGTNMSAAIVNGITGAVVAKETIETLSMRGAEDGMRRLQALIERVVAQAAVPWEAILGIGMGCTGPLDIERGLVQNPFTLPNWDNLPIVQVLTDAFQKPVLLLNDAQAAALGEFHGGAGRGTHHMVYVTVSTGIGGGLILDGRLYRGRQFLAGEVGHQSIHYDGLPCYCGRRGCWEMYASGPAIAQFAQARVTPDSLLWQLAEGHVETITARMVGQAAQQGDPMALTVLREAGLRLGAGIANLINILSPELFVMGGGVMQSHAFILPAVREVLQQQQYTEGGAQIQVVLAQLGLNAGVIGAAYGLLHSFDQALL